VCPKGENDSHQDNCDFLHHHSHFSWLKFLAE
jgi:hypothetical protein